MNNNIGFKNIEGKIYKSYQQDGLWDIAIGLFFLVFGITMLFDYAWLIGVYIAIFIPAWKKLRTSIVSGRLGYVEFGAERKASEKMKMILFSIILFCSVLMGAVLAYAYSSSSEIAILFRRLGLIPFGIVLTTLTIIGGIFMEIRRFILYGVLILIFFIAGHIFHSDPEAYFILLGIIFLSAGMVILLRFLKRYPKQNKDLTDGTKVLGQ
jgi:hypothetical protein